MREPRLPAKALCWTLIAVALAALLCIAVLAANDPPKLTILLKNTGMTVSPSTSPRAGDYTVVVKNFASTPRGIQMTGTDKGGTQYVRYSKVVAKGSMDSFKWFFPRRHNVVVKDVLSCDRDARACIKPTYAGHTVTLRFR